MIMRGFSCISVIPLLEGEGPPGSEGLGLRSLASGVHVFRVKGSSDLGLTPRPTNSKLVTP